MPAVTVEDPLTLPRISEVTQTSDTADARSVVSITTAPEGLEGEGFPVHRAFANVSTDLLDPFLHMDEMGAVEYAPGEPKGTPWHPHRGFETVTYMIDGTFVHQDSQGGGGVITNGATQWMTAGSGLLHIEAPPEDLVVSGGLFHGLQLWVNLPKSLKMTTPRYQDLQSNDVVLLASPDGGTLIRVIAGDVDGHRGPGSTHTPIAMVHATLAPGAELRLPWDRSFNALAYVMSGSGTVGNDRQEIRNGQLALLQDGGHLVVRANERQQANMAALEVVLLGGQPIREPVAAYGPFVMNTRAELVQAFEDYQAGRLGVIPNASD